ncbi:integrase family protein [Burkholderia sp. JPY481]|uniref:integrase arm-type DNA-binding domain-containing protein n=1 Tax=Paraburkholderia sp. JPY465 TaxID=3042285 RepID=UPI00317AEF55
MAKTNLTAARVAAFQCEPGKQQAILYDAKTRGFGLRVTSAGARAYIVEGRLHGRTIRCTIGDPANWKLEDARQHAADLRVLIDKGTDPREQEALQRAAADAKREAAQRREATVDDAWKAYLAYQKDRQQRGVEKAWGERHMLEHVRLAATGGIKKKRGNGVTQAGPLAELMMLRLPELTGERIAKWLEHLSDRPALAALAYRLLRAFIRWCEDTSAYQSLVPADAYRARAVKEAVPSPKAREGDCLQREQLRAWFDGMRKIGNPVIAAYLQTLLLVGPRREELAALRWTDVDFRWGSLSLSDKVESEGRVVPLPPYVASLLLDLKRRNDTPPNVRALTRMEARGEKWEPSPWVFSSRTAKDGKLAEPRIAHAKALRAAGLPHISLHGLRRSFGTLSEWVECPVGVVAQIQGHKPSAIAEKHYRRRPLDLLRLWHCRIEAWMLEEAGIEFKAEEGKSGLQAVS